MKRSAAIGLGVLVLAVALGAWLLLREDSSGGDAEVLAGRHAAEAAPGFGEAAVVTREGTAGESARAAPLAVDAPGAAPVSQRILAGHTLRAADHSPLPGILLVMPGEGDLVARSGPDGAFRFEHAPAGETLLAGGPRSEVPVVVPLPDAAGDLTELEVVLDSGWIQPGTVRDEGGGPLAGAEISVSLHQPGLPEIVVWEDLLDSANPYEWLTRVTRTGADGSFRMLDLPYTFHTLDANPPWSRLAASAGPLAAPDAEAARHVDELLREGSVTRDRVAARLLLGARAAGWSKQVQPVVTPEGPTVAPPVAFELSRGGALAGRVVDGRGAPRPGVRVGAAYVVTEESAGTARPGLSDVTGEDGQYRIEGVPPAIYVLSSRAVEGAGRRERRLLPGISVRAGETTTVDIVMGLEALLQGVVIDAAGQPVVDADIELLDRITWPGGTSRGTSIFSYGSIRVFEDEGGPVTEILQHGDVATTVEDGSFSLGPLGAGPRRLLVTKRSDPTLSFAIVDVLIDELRPPPDLVVTLPRALRLAGRVIDEAGAPLAGVIVALGGSSWPYAMPEVLTDADGRFALGVEGPGSYSLEILLDGYIGQELGVDLAADRTDLVVKLERAAAVQVVVLDAVSLLPVTSYELWLIGDGGMITHSVHAEDGAFRQELGGADPLAVQVMASGYATARVEHVVPSDTAIEPLRVLLQRE